MNMKLECMLKIIETKARWGESVDIVAERIVVVYFFTQMNSQHSSTTTTAQLRL